MQNSIRRIALLGLISAGLGWTAATAVNAAIDPAMDPVKVGPNIYKSIFENDRTRVMEISFKPGESIAMHSHPDHFAYALNDGSLKITGADGKAVDVMAKTGQLFWMDAQSHAAVNTGKTTFRLLVVELKEPKPMMNNDAMKMEPAKTEPAKPATKSK